MKTPNSTKAESSAPNTRKFTGTDNARALRAIHALLVRPRRRADLDDISGQQNSPELVAELRRRGLEIPCERISFIDRDGKPCRPGVYDFTQIDRRLISDWQRRTRTEGTNGKRS